LERLVSGRATEDARSYGEGKRGKKKELCRGARFSGSESDLVKDSGGCKKKKRHMRKAEMAELSGGGAKKGGQEGGLWREGGGGSKTRGGGGKEGEERPKQKMWKNQFTGPKETVIRVGGLLDRKKKQNRRRKGEKKPEERKREKERKGRAGKNKGSPAKTKDGGSGFFRGKEQRKSGVEDT